jgi:hypothetical protein
MVQICRLFHHVFAGQRAAVIDRANSRLNVRNRRREMRESAFSAYVLSTWPFVFIYMVTGSLNRAGGVLVAAP